MTKTQNTKQYDLEDRTLEFARRCRVFVKILPKTIGNIEDGKQLIKSSGSVGANYIEANEAFSKRDFVIRTKTCRKEAKESRYWLRLIDTNIPLRNHFAIMWYIPTGAFKTSLSCYSNINVPKMIASLGIINLYFESRGV